jgi:hypothetical protein
VFLPLGSVNKQAEESKKEEKPLSSFAPKASAPSEASKIGGESKPSAFGQPS